MSECVGGKLQIYLMNSTDSDIQLYKHSKVGKITPVEKIPPNDVIALIQETHRQDEIEQATLMTPEAFPLEQINQKVTIEDVLLKVDMTNSVLSPAGKQELQQIIRENQKVFLPNEDGKISFTPYLQHKIHLAEDKVVRVTGLRIPRAWRAEVKEQVQQLVR